MTNAQMAVLVSKILNGDSEAFSALYRATYKSAYFHAKTVLKNEQDVEDVLQEAYTTVYTRLDTLDNPEAVAAWINQIVTFTSLHKLRGSKNQASFSLDDEDFYYEPVACDGDSPDKLVELWGTEEILSGIIEQLPEAQRLTVIMFYYDDMRVADIAKVMGCSENTVKSRLNYARKNIEAAVREEEKRGVKLYSVSPALLLAALRRLVNTMPSASALPPAVLPAGTRAASASATSGRSSAARRVATTTGHSGGTKHAAGKTAAHAARHGAKAVAAGNVAKATAATGVTAKLVSGVAAAAILVGGIGTAVAIRSGAFPVTHPTPTPTAAVETSVDPTPEADVAVIVAEEKSEIPDRATELPESSVPVEAESLDVRRGKAISLYRRFVMDAEFDRSTRFCLRDLDGDGIEELMLIRPTEILYGNASREAVEAYTARNGQVERLGTQEGSMAEMGQNSIELLNLYGNTYLGLVYSNSEWSSAWSEAVLLEVGRLDAVHTVSVNITYAPENYHEQVTDTSVLLDGQSIEYGIWEQARGNAEVLLSSFGDDGQTQLKFLAETAWADNTAHTVDTRVPSEDGEAYKTAYAPVFEAYHTYLTADEQTKRQMTNPFSTPEPEEPGVAFLCQRCTAPGYSFLDMDEDGIPELIVSSYDSEYFKGQIFELYTLKNGKPYRVLAGGDRDRYQLYPGRLIANDGSSGANSDSCWLYRLRGQRLEPVSALIHEYDEYYQFTGPREYPYTRQPGDVVLTRAGYHAKVREIIDAMLMPELTPFT